MNKAFSVAFCVILGSHFAVASAQKSAKTTAGKTAATSEAMAPNQESSGRTDSARTPQKPEKVFTATSDREVNGKGQSATTAPAPLAPSSTELSLTEIYRVGAGDVIDIRIRNLATNGSTLFTVMGGGLIDLPVIGGSVQVAGLTTDEIQAQLVAELKRRALHDAPQVTVSVRQYASHSIAVTGLVVSGGTKILRREAVPLYVVLAETQSRLDAAQASIMRAGNPTQTIDLTDPSSAGVLIRPGDVINVTARPQEFYYIGGRIGYPGQKAFLPGLTLMQSILAAGGLRQAEGIVELSREGADGNLSTTRYNLKDIKSGKTRDPRLIAGDRIEIIK